MENELHHLGRDNPSRRILAHRRRLENEHDSLLIAQEHY